MVRLVIHFVKWPKKLNMKKSLLFCNSFQFCLKNRIGLMSYPSCRFIWVRK